MLEGRKGLVHNVKNGVLEHFASRVEGKDRPTLVIWYLGSRVEDQSPMKSKSHPLNQLLPYSVLQQLFWVHLSANQKAINARKEKLSPEEIWRKDSFQNP